MMLCCCVSGCWHFIRSGSQNITLAPLDPHDKGTTVFWKLRHHSTETESHITEDMPYQQYHSGDGPGCLVSITIGYTLDGPGDRIPVGARFSAPVQTSLLYRGYRVFPGGKVRLGRDTDPSPPLVPWSRKSRAIPLLPIWAIRPVQSLNACTRLHLL